MEVLLYILTPIGAYIVNLLMGIAVGLITIPLTMIMVKIQKNPIIYRMRPDMLITGVLRGFIVVYLTSNLLSQFETEVNFWWIVATMVLLSYLSIYAWDKSKPYAYEFSLNVSPIFGYIIGLFVI